MSTTLHKPDEPGILTERANALLQAYARHWNLPAKGSIEFNALFNEMRDRNDAWMVEVIDRLGDEWHEHGKVGRPPPARLWRGYNDRCRLNKPAAGGQVSLSTGTCSSCRGSGWCETLQAGPGTHDLKFVHPDATGWPAGTTCCYEGGVPCLCEVGRRVMGKRNKSSPGHYDEAALLRLHKLGYTMLVGGAPLLRERLGGYLPGAAPRAAGPPAPLVPAPRPGPYPNASQAAPFATMADTVAPALTAPPQPARRAQNWADVEPADDADWAGATP